ncbi:transposase [Caulobacter sp. Root1472]|uniref:transposase n=1 Tax=Caulobacter sp. Root1472 TaxID=1736470 RepID=UPI00138F0469
MTETAPVRRLEVFTGARHRRTWSAQAKRQIVAESCSGLETACSVARRYGLAPTQLFTWRRELRAMAPPPSSEPMFAPVVVEPPCVDGSLSARMFLSHLQGSSVRPCVRPVDAALKGRGP